MMGTHIDILRVVFVCTAISVVVVAVWRRSRTLTTLGGGEECTLCWDGAWLWLFWENFEFS
jgi:hypothetical protein